jgi:hypothetical protein
MRAMMVSLKALKEVRKLMKQFKPQGRPITDGVQIAWVDEKEKTMTLRQKQSKFAEMFAMLILFARWEGYEITIGEVHRHKDATHGHKKSLHKLKLAGDLHLYKNGKYQRSTKAHKKLGAVWESMGGSWGGHWGDGNHYSLAHGRMK